MQELVELVRRDHALIDDLVAGRATVDAPAPLADVLRAHLDVLDVGVGPALRSLGRAAQDEWLAARADLQRAIDVPGEAAAALRAHAEQMEQVVLPRLLAEADEGELADLTAAALRRHDELPLGPTRPAAMRAEVTDRGPDSSRPAGT